MLQDLRFGFKLLPKEKAFTIAALLTLALCIGANTAIFTVLHAVILAPLPFPDPDRLVSMGNICPGAGITESVQNSIPDYLDRRRMTDVFESVAEYIGTGYDTGAEGSPVRLKADQVTPSYFHVLRAMPLMGRLFTEDDAVFRKNQFAILSYGLWKEMFARDPAVPGKDVRLSGVNYRVIGVMPEAFGQPGREARRDRKAAMAICLVFALLALSLSAIGIYAVLAYAVTQRTREFGIRMALGASAGSVVGMVIGHGARLAAVGLVIGVAGAFGVTRLMSDMLFGVRPADPLVFGAVAVALMSVALAAPVVPSVRITPIRPAHALRYE